MNYSGYELLWMFFVYAFLGWVTETVYATLKRRHFANRGLINGPFCIMYGLISVVISCVLPELDGIWLFIGSMIYGSVGEWITGHLIEWLFHEVWWDYSNRKYSLGKYIYGPKAVFWGIAGFILIKWGNYFIIGIYHLCPSAVGMILLMVLVGVLAVDAIASYMLINGIGKNLRRWKIANENISNVTGSLGNWIARQLNFRIHRAYQAKYSNWQRSKSDVFAEGCSFYKIAMLFFIGAFIGDLTETVFCRMTMGVWMSRSSVVWGPFSIVWGFAIAGATALLYRCKDSRDGFLFGVGTFLGGAYEYLCSVFTEKVFGTVFWTYEHMKFNLAGRINLLYCFFWGIAAVVWFKMIYPHVSAWIEKIPKRVGIIVTWVLIVFMVCNMAVSSLALIRRDERSNGIEATQAWQEYMDIHYDDVKMKQIYPKAVKT